MGFEDRQYFREDSIYGGNRSGLGQYSIVVILIAANLIVWVIDTFSPEHLVNSWLRLDSDLPWRVWTFLTYGFTHSAIEVNPFHIIFNMFILFMFGRPVAERLGRHEFLRFYLTAIVVSGLAFFLWHVVTGSRAAAIGASGATTAVLILFILWYPHQKLALFGVVEVPAWALGVGVIAFDLIRALGETTGEDKSSVAWQAHLGGAAFAWMYLHFKWNFSWMTSLTGWIPKPKNRLSIYNPESRSNRSDELRKEGDRILKKISEQGEESLNRKERKSLERYSKMLRKEK